MSDIAVLDTVDEIKAEELGERLGVAASTIRKHAGILDKKGYRFKKNQHGHWIFVQADFQVLKDFYEIKEKPGVTLELAAEIAVTRYRNENQGEITLTQPHEIVHPASAMVFKKMDEMQSTLQSMEKKMIALEEKRAVETRTEAITAQLTILRIQRVLRKEALEKWEQEPEEKRMVKTGFLFKKMVENKDLKEEFIREYIDENLESRLKNELI